MDTLLDGTGVIRRSSSGDLTVTRGGDTKAGGSLAFDDRCFIISTRALSVIIFLAIRPRSLDWRTTTARIMSSSFGWN